MSLQGLPDFQDPIQGAGFQIFYPYEGVGSHVLLPDGLEIAQREDGRPNFMLELVRGASPLLPPSPHGVLDLRVEPHYPAAEALPQLRARYPGAALAPAIFANGFLRLQPGGATNLPGDLLEPVSLAWNGLTMARFTLRLSLSSALLLKGALQDELLALYATAELEVRGVAPRAPVAVSFDPAKVLAVLAALGDAERRVRWEDLLSFFHQDPTDLPIEIAGAVPNLEEFSRALAYRVRARFGTLVPAPSGDGRAYVALVAASEVGTGHFDWDLAEPHEAVQPVILSLHPLETARRLVQSAGLEAVTRNTVVPTIPSGVLPVSIWTNMPRQPSGMPAFGVLLHAAPRPPHRPQAIVVSAELTPPQDSATVFLRFAPLEAPDYTYTTYLLLLSSTGLRRLEGLEIAHSGDRLDLGPADFPADFVPVAARPPLLEIATVEGRCRWEEDGTPVEQSFALDQDHPAIALVLPTDASVRATLMLVARERSGTKELVLGPYSAAGLVLDLDSFPEYGPQRVRCTCTFGGTIWIFAIDLLPEGQTETLDEISTLHFTPDDPVKEWTYLVKSPFHPGYRYRVHGETDAAPVAWSEIRSPFELLSLHAEDQGGTP